MKKHKRKAANGNIISTDGKEEISLELAEFDNLKPKQEPMTPNQRDKTEREKSK